MAITRLTKHDTHPVSAELNKSTHTHYARLVCNKCRVHIQWLNKTQYQQIQGDKTNA